MKGRPWAAALGLLVTLAGCRGHARLQPAAAHGALGGQVAARVGDVDIPARLVAEVASKRRVSPGEALALLVDDAVAAKGALAAKLDATPAVRLATTTARARAILDRLKADAYATPPTDDEVRKASEAHWMDVDRPETMVAIHAVVLRPAKPDAAKDAAGKAVAAQIAAAVAGATDEADFEARAKAVPAGSSEVKVERLDPFAADGRVAMPGPPQQYDKRFAAGAAALAAPGATTGVVESDFGWHVIRLLERRPPLIVPFEERRKMFTDEVHTARAGAALDALLAAGRSAEAVTLSNGLDDLLAQAMPAEASSPASP